MNPDTILNAMHIFTHSILMEHLEVCHHPSFTERGDKKKLKTSSKTNSPLMTEQRCKFEPQFPESTQPLLQQKVLVSLGIDGKS